jgi:hypothetical protein
MGAAAGFFVFMTQRQPLFKWTFRDGFVAAASYLADGLDALVEGSRNLLLLGAMTVQGQLIPSTQRPWKGLQSKGASTGSRKMCQVGKTWGGIKDIGGTLGAGSLFEDFGRMLVMIGAGQPSIAGADITGVTLSTSLKLAVAVAGVYSAANTYTAGLGQPSSPDVGIVSSAGAGFTGLVDGPISIKIARFRSATGGRSRASTTSAVITPSKQSFFITFPAAASGQDFWHVFVTQQGFGGVGLHYALPHNGSLDIPEAAVAAATLGGVARTLEFEFKDGDLVKTTAYVDDFAPPAATHAARIGRCMVLGGAYGDSSSAVSSTSTGTAWAVSLPNFYESYRPRDILFSPEQLVDVLSREWDDHGYAVHKNCVTTLQYVGLVDGPAVSAGVAWPDVGFQYPHNVCQFFGRLAGMVAKGSLVMMDEGGRPDYSWGAEIRDFIKDWAPEDTKVGFHPDNLSLVVMNGGTAVNYSLENKKWGAPEYFADANVSGSALSCTTSQGELVVSVNNGGAHTAYKWDAGASSMPVTAVTSWRESPRPVNVHELAASFDTDSAGSPLVVGAHCNMRKTHARDFSVANASNVLTSAAFGFDPEHTGDVVCVFGANVGGAGVNHLVARLTYASATTATMTDPVTGATLNAQATLSGLYGLVAHDMAAVTLARAGAQHTGPLTEFLVREAISSAVSLNLVTSAGRGQFLNAAAWGTTQGEGVSRTA